MFSTALFSLRTACFAGASFFSGRFFAFFSVHSPTTRRFFNHLKNAMTKEERHSPDTPNRPSSAKGSAVRHKMMIRVVSGIFSIKTGKPADTASMPASIAFLSLNAPPNRVEPSIKFGGIV